MASDLAATGRSVLYLDANPAVTDSWGGRVNDGFHRGENLTTVRLPNREKVTLKVTVPHFSRGGTLPFIWGRLLARALPHPPPTIQADAAAHYDLTVLRGVFYTPAQRVAATVVVYGTLHSTPHWRPLAQPTLGPSQGGTSILLSQGRPSPDPLDLPPEPAPPLEHGAVDPPAHPSSPRPAEGGDLLSTPMANCIRIGWTPTDATLRVLEELLSSPAPDLGQLFTRVTARGSAVAFRYWRLPKGPGSMVPPGAPGRIIADYIMKARAASGHRSPK